MLPLCESQRLSSTQKCYIASTIVAIALIVLSFQNLNAAQFQGIGTIGSTMCLGAGAVLILGTVIHALISKKESAPKKEEAKLFFYSISSEENAERVKQVLVHGFYFPYSIDGKNHLLFGRDDTVIVSDSAICEIPRGYRLIPPDIFTEMMNLPPIDHNAELNKGEAFVNEYDDYLRSDEYTYYQYANQSTLYRYKEKSELKNSFNFPHAKQLCRMEVLCARKKLLS